MSRARPALFARLTPARIVALAVLGSIPVKLLTEKLSDPDLWWHLRTGRLILETNAIPRADVFSYTAHGERWVVQEWGSEVFLHALRNAFGLYGILFFRALVLGAVYALVARLLVRRMGSGMGAWAFLGLVAYAGSVNWTERPNILSYALFVVTLGLLDRRGRAVWWFVPLAVLWANLHGMVIVGVGLVAVVAIAEGLKVAVRWPDADAAWARRLAAVTLAGAAAVLVNPVGPRLYVHMLELVRAVRDVVTEWGSPDFHESGTMIFLVLILVTVAALSLSPRRADPTDVALALAFTFLALQAVRNLAMSSIVIGLVAARYLPSAVAAVRKPPREAAPVGARSSAVMGALGLVLAVGGLGAVLAQGFPRANTFDEVVSDRYPREAADRLDVRGVRVFVFDVWSGLVIDRAWPNATVYSDLRTDVYGLERSRRYQRTIAAFPDALGSLDAACTTHVLIRPRDPLAQLLERTPDWSLVHRQRLRREGARAGLPDAEDALIFERRAPAPGCAENPIPRV